MKKLKEANLYRGELIPISGKLVTRYNECLTKLGFTKTKLKTFSIDGIGWSPEIAEEKDEMHYLNNGEANLHGIIISPLQKGKPVYVPFHSFDREMMLEVFKVHGDKINDITRDSAICVDFDQDIDAFYEPLDILKYETIRISFHLINNLDAAQKEQSKLIEKFKEDTNFIDENLHQQLLESAKKYGDLRQRDVTLSKIHYTANSFFTKAFGGIYVLRDFVAPIVVFEEEQSYKEAIKDTVHDVMIYHIEQKELIHQLRDHVIIDYDLDVDVKTKRYERIKKYIFSQHLKKTQHPINDILSDSLLFKSYLNKMELEARKRVMGVERYLEKSEVSNEYKIADIVDQKMFHALHSPHSKEEFYKQFKTWDESMKDWVIDTIRNNI